MEKESNWSIDINQSYQSREVCVFIINSKLVWKKQFVLDGVHLMAGIVTIDESGNISNNKN